MLFCEDLYFQQLTINSRDWKHHSPAVRNLEIEENDILEWLYI